jgi:predicted Zn-dependent peptidase
MLLAAELAPAAAAQTAIGPEPIIERGLGFQAAPSGLSYRLFDVPGATHAAIVAAMRVGGWHDPAGRTGLAHLLAQHIGATQEPRPEGERWMVRPYGPATVLSITCARADLPARLRELARFLGGELDCSEATVQRSRVQTLLRIDDLQFALPGPRLLETARRQVCRGTPAGKQLFGVPAEVQAVTAAELRAWFEQRCRPEHTSLVVLGAVAPTEAEAIVTREFQAPGPRTPTAELTVHDSAGPLELDGTHSRIAAPFVSVAIKAPEQTSAQWVPFLIAMGALNARAHVFFGSHRGREADALFPFFSFSYRYGDAFALLNRRGEDGADVETVRGELRVVIKRLRTQGAELGDVQQGAFEVASVNMLPPYERQLELLARRHELLLPRADTLALAHVLGWSATLPGDVGRVPVVDVQRALQTFLADANLTWLSLVSPPPRAK